jgi:DNA-binding MarR family transcriptional regulator
VADGHDFAMHLRGAYLSLHRQANAHFAPFGLTADQFVLLAALAREDGVTQQELVRRSFSDANTVRAMLVLLERRGLVARKRHVTDGRARSVSLTAKGRRLHEELREVNESFHAGTLALFPPDELGQLLGYLNRITRHLAPANHRRTRDARAAEK